MGCGGERAGVPRGGADASKQETRAHLLAAWTRDEWGRGDNLQQSLPWGWSGTDQRRDIPLCQSHRQSPGHSVHGSQMGVVPGGGWDRLSFPPWRVEPMGVTRPGESPCLGHPSTPPLCGNSVGVPLVPLEHHIALLVNPGSLLSFVGQQFWVLYLSCIFDPSPPLPQLLGSVSSDQNSWVIQSKGIHRAAVILGGSPIPRQHPADGEDRMPSLAPFTSALCS